MKKTSKTKREPDMLDEYDFSNGVKGKYAKEYAQAGKFIALAPDLVAIFPDSEAVNKALWAPVNVARKATKKTA